MPRFQSHIRTAHDLAALGRDLPSGHDPMLGSGSASIKGVIGGGPGAIDQPDLAFE